MAIWEDIQREQASEFRIESSPNDLRQFQRSHVWKDMKRWIEMKNAASMRELINASEESEFRTLQGRLQTGVEMANLIDTLIDLREDDGRDE